MPNDTHNPPPEANDDAAKPAPLRWLWKFNHGLDVVKGLSMVTVLSSLAVGYFQYLNAYQDKVGGQAKEDMAAATSTFTDISRAFSEVRRRGVLATDKPEEVRINDVCRVCRLTGAH